MHSAVIMLDIFQTSVTSIRWWKCSMHSAVIMLDIFQTSVTSIRWWKCRMHNAVIMLDIFQTSVTSIRWWKCRMHNAVIMLDIFQTSVTSIRWWKCRMHNAVFMLDIFQTSVTSVRWWKFFMETGQTITVTGQRDSCLSTTTRALLANCLPPLEHTYTACIPTHLCLHSLSAVFIFQCRTSQTVYRKLPVNVNLDSVWVWFNSQMIVNYHSVAGDTRLSLTVCHYLFRKVLLWINWSFTLLLCFSLRGKLGSHLMFFVQSVSCDILIGWSAWVIILVAQYSLLRHWNHDIEVADLNPSLEDGLPLWHPHPVLLCPLPSCNLPPPPTPPSLSTPHPIFIRVVGWVSSPFGGMKT